MTANAFMSVSLSPPLVLISIDRRAKMGALLHEGTRFGVSVLEARQTGLSDRFAGRIADELPEATFEIVHETPLVDSALAHLVARVVRSYWGGDHSLFLGQVEFARYGEGRPLLFHGGRYERLVDDPRLLSLLPRELLDPILALGEVREYADGEPIMQMGEEGCDAPAARRRRGTRRAAGPLAHARAGELIGEIEVLDPGGGRIADIHAVGQVRALGVSRRAAPRRPGGGSARCDRAHRSARRPLPRDGLANGVGARATARCCRRPRARRLVDRHARAPGDPRPVRRRDHLGGVGAHVVQPRARAARRARRVRLETQAPRGVRRRSVVFAGASLACGLAPSFEVLVGARCVQAVGAALVVTAALDLLAQLQGGDEPALRTWVAAGVLGAALGPAAGGILTQLLGWESIFLVQVPLALALLLAVRGVTGRSVRMRAGRPSITANAALLLVAGGLVAALFLVVLLLVDGWGMSPAAAGVVVTVIPLVAIVVGRLRPSALGPVQGIACGVILLAGGPRRPRADAARGLGLDDSAADPRRRRARADRGRPHRARAAQPSRPGRPRRVDDRGAARRRRARARPAGPGADDRARGEPRRGDPRRRGGRPRQRDPAARQARRRAGRARRGRSRERGRRAAGRRACVRGATRRRRVARADGRAAGAARPCRDERLLGAVPARRGADAVCARTRRARCGGGSHEAASRRCSSRSGSSRPSSCPTSRSAADGSIRPRSPTRARRASGRTPTGSPRRSSASRSRASTASRASSASLARSSCSRFAARRRWTSSPTSRDSTATSSRRRSPTASCARSTTRTRPARCRDSSRRSCVAPRSRYRPG